MYARKWESSSSHIERDQVETPLVSFIAPVKKFKYEYLFILSLVVFSSNLASWGMLDIFNPVKFFEAQCVDALINSNST